MNLVETYAPTLAHLDQRLEPYECFILSKTAGPQPQAKDPETWGTEPHILIQVQQFNPFPDDFCYVCIRSETDCIVNENGDSAYITFQDLLDYLAQFPRPLYSFDRA